MEKKMTNRQTRALETRKKIIYAAKVLIAEKGFDETSIEDIAKKAGVSTGSFYTYFKKKEEVVDELSKSDFYRLSEIANGMSDSTIIEKLKFYCNYFLRDIEETGIEICRQWLKNNLIQNNMYIAGEEIPKYRYDYRCVQSILNESVKQKELSQSTPTDELALYINAQLYGLMVIWCMTDGEIKGSEKTDSLCDMVIKTALEPYEIK